MPISLNIHQKRKLISLRELKRNLKMNNNRYVVTVLPKKEIVGDAINFHADFRFAEG